ncbi:hypothetical protein [Pseudophaeobacter sp.]|uniref:hypothetical protein n=1 Tax=Pseudophaeobacter sp. TaxID=1971739 RepID=UPI00405A39A5
MQRPERRLRGYALTLQRALGLARHAIQPNRRSWNIYRFTYSDVVEHCDTSSWAWRIFLKELQRDGVVVPSAREGKTQYFEVVRTEGRAVLQGNESSIKLPPVEPHGAEEKANWAYIHDHAYFTFEDIARVCVVGGICTRFMGRLRKHGIIREWSRSGGRIFYTAKQPEDLRDQEKAEHASDEGAIWTAIRHQKKFRPVDLFAALSPARPDITQGDILNYGRVLRTAGYLRASART